MAKHDYFSTAHWKALRRAALKRDGYCCTVAHCYQRATVVDHIGCDVDGWPFATR